MSLTYAPGAPLGVGQTLRDAASALEQRVRLVLETRPGDLPWRPDFGCDLGGLVGQPATAARLQDLRWRVEAALRRWIPDARVRSCRVRLLREEPLGAPDPLPTAEAALLRLGPQCAVEIDLQLQVESSPTSLLLRLEP